MNGFASTFHSSLPLCENGSLETPKDWSALFARLKEMGTAVLLESSGKMNEAGSWVILAGKPEKEFFEKDGQAWTRNDSEPRPAPFEFPDFLDQVTFSSHPGRGATAHSGIGTALLDQNGGARSFTPLPYCLSAAWFGVVSYEYGSTQSKRPFLKKTYEGTIPEFYFFKPRYVLAFNRLTREYFAFGGTLKDLELEKSPLPGPFKVSGIQPQSSSNDYKLIVRKAKDYIAQGDIYQANLSQSFRAQWQGDPTSLYRLLKELNPAPFMGLFRGRGFTVVSSSPERLVSCNGDRLEMKPIAGTRPRGKDIVEDLQLQWELKTNPKEQAEHLMLVDLTRNDLGRVARYGTVEVGPYAEVESYARVHHLVSTIRAKRLPAAGLSKILKSVFPGGTITGCPKIRCMEIIRELEPEPRGFYTGSMGYIAPDLCFDLNILIRTFTLLDNGELDFHAGAGIVADSDPEKEYLETLYKVEALAQALGGSLL